MTINSEQFQKICKGVWQDRVLVIEGRGFLSGEAALMRAVYWRLAKAGIRPMVGAESYGSLQTASSYELGVSCLLEVHGRPRFDATQFLNNLVERCEDELRESC
jgi:hypothetical protein